MELKYRELIIAGLAAYIIWGYAVYWLPVLRYGAYAFVAGGAVTLMGIGALVLLTPGWPQQDGARAYRRPNRAAFGAEGAWEQEKASQARSGYSPVRLFPASFVVSDNLDAVLDLVLRDFITSWYSNISPSPAFAIEVDRTIRTALVSIRDRLLQLDFVDVAISRVIPIITNHLREFDQAERVIRGKKLNRNVTESEELDLAIAGKYREGRLHPAASLSFADTRLLQQEHSRKVASRLLQEVVPGDLLKSRAVSVLLQEIVACAILSPVMQLLSDPDTWNQLLEGYGRTMIQDRKSVRKLRAALDEHATPPRKPPATMYFPRLGGGDTERNFERFVRAIRQCNNLSDARRFKSEVASQLAREASIKDQDEIYLRRLKTGKRLLDQKVEKLAAIGRSTEETSHHLDSPRGRDSQGGESATLLEVLRDAAGLSYFMEYMDRHRLMTLVQFWVVVDGFRNPLENDVHDDEEIPNAPLKWTNSDRLDIAQIHDAYLSKPELGVPEERRLPVKSFLEAGVSATPLQHHRARSAILRTQTAVLDEMRTQHFPRFKRSDLYYKYLTVDESPTKPGPKFAQHAARQLEFAPAKELPLHTSKGPRSAAYRPANDNKLRRAAASSSDLTSTKERLANGTSQRRSLDVNPSAPLFPEDDYDTDPLAHSTEIINTDGNSLKDNQLDGSQEQMVQAMEAALNDIVENRPQVDNARIALFDSQESGSLSPHLLDSSRASTEFSRIKSPHGSKDPRKPNLASLGLISTSSRLGVFSDENLFDDGEKFLEDEHTDPEEAMKEKLTEDEIVQAAPGDLGLAEAISALTLDLERLVIQDSIVDTLTRKAELTNNVAELRILGKSKSSLEREIRRKELQRQQYIAQESDNSLFGRATVEIKSIMVGKDEEGQEFALYVIEVQRKAGEQMPAASWAVARRYSEFHDLHQRLRSTHPAVRQLDFPRRRLVLKLQKDFLQKRRSSLEKYLRELLRMPAVCRSRDLRAFLSQQAIISSHNQERGATNKDIITRIYNSVTDSIDDFIENIPVLDQLSIAGQNLISAATSQLSTMPSAMMDDSVNIAEAEAELNAFESRELEPFVKPICDIFLELFDLKRGNNWLRGRAVVVVLHQLLGGTIERKVREYVKTLGHEDSILGYISLIRNSMWPFGQPRQEVKARTDSEKHRSRKEARIMLATLIPDMAGNVVGKSNAQAASRRIFAVLNNERLNTHLAFTLLDEFVQVLFGDARLR